MSAATKAVVLAAALAFAGACSESGGDGGAGGSGGGGGTPSDGGTPNAGGNPSSGGSPGVGAGEPGGGGSGGSPQALLLSDGFEADAVGAMPDPDTWVPSITGDGTIEVSNERAHNGTQSLHVVSPSGSYETFVHTTMPFPVTNNTFWGRLYFYIDSTMPTDFVHWTVMEARGQGSDNRVRIGGINNGSDQGFYGHSFLFNVETQGQGEIAIDDEPRPQVPAGTWTCIEWMYKGVEGQNESRFFWDGVERTKLHAEVDFFEGIYAMPAFDRLYVGWGIYQPIDEPYEVWIDDVAVAGERIGCD